MQYMCTMYSVLCRERRKTPVGRLTDLVWCILALLSLSQPSLLEVEVALCQALNTHLHNSSLAQPSHASSIHQHSYTYCTGTTGTVCMQSIKVNLYREVNNYR